MPAHQLLRESVLLTLIKGSEKIDRAALITALAEVTAVTEIDSFGSLGNFQEWYVIFKTPTARGAALRATELKVGDQVFLISEPYKHVKTVRLFSLPTTVSDDEIRSLASQWGGTVLSVEAERLPQPFHAIKTFVRRVRIRFANRQDEEKVPLSIRISGLAVTVQLEGRQKVCFRCNKAGHVKAECRMPKCRGCNQLGHDDPACTLKRSYAAATASTPANVDVTPSRLVGASVSTQVEVRSENTPKEKEQQVRRCRKCKQVGHSRKECQLAKSVARPAKQTDEQQRETPVQVRDEPTNGIGEKTPASAAADVEASESPRLRANEAKEKPDIVQTNPAGKPQAAAAEEANQRMDLDEKEETTSEAEGSNGQTDTVSALEHRAMYEAYKNPSNELKRAIADRSIDSDAGGDAKKQHTCDSSFSLPEGSDEGEIVDN